MSLTPLEVTKDKEIQAFSLRVPADLVGKIDIRAKAFQRTRTAEIIYLLKVGIKAKGQGFVMDGD